MSLLKTLHGLASRSGERRESFDSGSLTTAMLTAALEASPDCVKLIGADGALLYMNQNGMCAMEIDDFNAVSGQEWAGLWPEEARQRVQLAVMQAVSGQATRFDAECPTAKGRSRWWRVRVSPVAVDGAVTAVLSQSRDITAELTVRRELDALQRRTDLDRDSANTKAMLDTALSARLARTINKATHPFRARRDPAEIVERLHRLTERWGRATTADERLALCKAWDQRSSSEDSDADRQAASA